MAGVNDMSGATRTRSQIRDAVEGDSAVAFKQATTISTTTGDLTLNPSGDTVIAGNLTVNGTTANVSTTNTVIEDKVIEIANGTSGTPSGDAGIIIERGSSANAAIIWDESRDEFVLGTTSATGASTGDLTVTPGNVSVERIGAGTEQAQAEVHAQRDASAGGTLSTTAGIISEDDARPAIQLVGSANNIGLIQFGDNAAAASGQLYYDHSTDKLRVDAGGSTDRLTVDGSGNVVAAGAVTATGFTIGNAAMSEAELETIDGVTAGTVTASKAVVVDANKDIASFRNITLTGELDAGSLDVSGDVDIDGTCEADAYTVNGQTLSAYIASVSVDAATLAATFTCTDNESANEDCPIVFVDGATGAQGAETDGDLHYNPSTGTVTATIFKGNIDAVDGDFDGTLETDALSIGGTTVSSTATELNFLDGSTANSVVNGKAVIYGNSGELAGTLSTAAQTNVTSLGTLTALTVDDVAVDGKVITMTGSTDDTATITVGTNGTLAITTVDTASDDADITVTADGKITLDAAGIVELDSGNGNFKFEKAGSTVLEFDEENSGDVVMMVATDGKDLIFKDHGEQTNMKILDAAAGINVPGEVQTTKIAYTDGDDAMTVADGGKVTFAAGFDVGSDAAGDMLYHNGTSYVRLAKGSADQVLTMNDAANAPGWETASGGGDTKELVVQTDSASTVSGSPGPLGGGGTGDAGIGASTVVIMCVTASGARYVQLPAVATATADRRYYIKDKSGNAATNNITIKTDGSEEIDGSSADLVISTNYASVQLVTDGTKWYII